jgi:dethiobiotin synthetase
MDAYLLDRISIPGLFITATDTGVGKTVVASAIAKSLSMKGLRVGVCKIAATGCIEQSGQLISEDAQMLSHAIGDRFPLETICPIRYVEPLAPAVAADRAGISLDWSLLQQSLNVLQLQSDVLIVEGVGGILVPMDDRHTVLDVARWLGLPTLVVARAGLGTINHTLLTVNALRTASVRIAGVVINRFSNVPADIAGQTNAAAIERWGKLSVLCILPDVVIHPPKLPIELIARVSAVDWVALARGNIQPAGSL